MRGRPTKLTPHLRVKILEAAQYCPNLRIIARAYKIRRETLYDWLRADEDFYADFYAALAQRKLGIYRRRMMKAETGDDHAMHVILDLYPDPEDPPGADAQSGRERRRALAEEDAALAAGAGSGSGSGSGSGQECQ